MRLRNNPETADINFLVLTSLEALPQLQKYVSACDELGEHIHNVEREIPFAAERYAAVWKGYQGTGTASLHGQEAEAFQVTEARAEVQAMQEQLGPPLTAVLHGLEACVATERLVGQIPGHGPARLAVGSILSYLRDVRALLQEAT